MSGLSLKMKKKLDRQSKAKQAAQTDRRTKKEKIFNCRLQPFLKTLFFNS